ncbi:R3H domain-containing protein 2 [Artemisia annua]|uniref:R3H domain-containing protein 2 n=1 Tax=Artemisia annua TaxID=35608 RepID=A0A2U1LCT6_ARTAN|nr:R3H domain-containing protein 2 [Artemisia annua]
MVVDLAKRSAGLFVIMSHEFRAYPFSRVMQFRQNKYPTVYLADVPTKLSENEKWEHIKVVLKPRPKLSSGGLNGLGKRCNSVRTVKERKEDWGYFSSKASSSAGATSIHKSCYFIGSILNLETGLIGTHRSDGCGRGCS